MRWKSSALCASLALLLASVPCIAAVKAMNLSELMSITTEAAHVKITASSTFHLDWPLEGAVWTKLTVQGESLRTEQPVSADVVFLGSHDPADQFGVSEMPTLQDTRVGSEAVIFWQGNDPDMPTHQNRVFALDSVYRVESSFGSPVVVGKGEGFAFPENVKLDDARKAVRATHLALAQKAGK
jgi:hypothetical protein